ncbi:hypothetical protein F4778DRAFT_784246 [Xylariomycetidae sp. FL2044]|nr:hypothetical protein F4778DRAFT_784246 [Xylariomycetidae sp. FL2044]
MRPSNTVTWKTAVLYLPVATVTFALASSGTQVANLNSSTDTHNPVKTTTSEWMLSGRPSPGSGCAVGTGEDCVADRWSCNASYSDIAESKVIIDWDKEKKAWRCRTFCSLKD